MLAGALVLVPYLLQRGAAAVEAPPETGARSLLSKVLAPPPPEKEPVLPATKTVREYVQVIYKSRPVAWQQIAQHIQKDEFYALSSELLLSPFDDLRQACFFIPWALLNNEEVNASSDARRAYDDLMDHVDDLDRVSRSAGRGEAPPAKVQQAFFLLNATLDKFISTVPKRYLRD
jgi:hypothetical protein